MMNRMCFSGTIGEALRDPQSKTAKAFFSGARAMMTALETMSPGEYQQALSAKNQQHIIALLVTSEERQRERRRSDMEALLKVYWVDKYKLRGFIFDVPAVDSLYGIATDINGGYIEDEDFQLLPNHQGVPYWPNYKITNDTDGSTITREEYFALDEDEQLNYSYIRYFMLETANKKPALQVSSLDPYAMEALIRQDILIGDIEVNRRYRYAITSDDPRFRKLKRFSGAILEAFAELGHSAHPTLAAKNAEEITSK